MAWGLVYWGGEWKQSLHKKLTLVLWMEFSFLRFKLKEEPYIQHRDKRHANRGTVLKICRLILRLTCISSRVVGVFHMVYCEDKKKHFAVLNMSWKTSLRRYVNQIPFLLLSLTESILLAINISTSCVAQNIRSHNGCSSFMHFRTSEVYTLSLRITVLRKVPIAKIWGFTPLNTSFMTQLGLKVVIIGKIIYMQSKWKICLSISLSVMPRNVHTYT